MVGANKIFLQALSSSVLLLMSATARADSLWYSFRNSLLGEKIDNGFIESVSGNGRYAALGIDAPDGRISDSLVQYSDKGLIVNNLPKTSGVIGILNDGTVVTFKTLKNGTLLHIQKGKHGRTVKTTDLDWKNRYEEFRIGQGLTPGMIERKNAFYALVPQKENAAIFDQIELGEAYSAKKIVSENLHLVQISLHGIKRIHTFQLDTVYRKVKYRTPNETVDRYRDLSDFALMFSPQSRKLLVVTSNTLTDKAVTGTLVSSKTRDTQRLFIEHFPEQWQIVEVWLDNDKVVVDMYDPLPESGFNYEVQQQELSLISPHTGFSLRPTYKDHLSQKTPNFDFFEELVNPVYETLGLISQYQGKALNAALVKISLTQEYTGDQAYTYYTAECLVPQKPTASKLLKENRLNPKVHATYLEYNQELWTSHDYSTIWTASLSSAKNGNRLGVTKLTRTQKPTSGRCVQPDLISAENIN